MICTGHRETTQGSSPSLLTPFHSILTPDIQPEFLEPCSAEAVDTKHNDSGTSESRRSNYGISASPMACVEAKATQGETPDKDSLACSGSDETSRYQDQEPHGQGKTTKQTSQCLRDVGED